MNLKKNSDDHNNFLDVLVKYSDILIMSVILILILISFFFFFPKKSEKNNILIVNQLNESLELEVEIARTSQEKSRGLMNRTQLDNDSGMLFVYDSEQPRTFWMKNTFISLDIVFINSTGKIINIAKSTKTDQTQERYSSEKPAQYVLEVNAGWTDKNNVELGNKVDLTNIDL